MDKDYQVDTFGDVLRRVEDGKVEIRELADEML